MFTIYTDLLLKQEIRPYDRISSDIIPVITGCFYKTLAMSFAL